MKLLKKLLFWRPKANLAKEIEIDKEKLRELNVPDKRLLPRKPLTFRSEPKTRGIKIALDESVGNAMAKQIEAKGYRIVCRAASAEPDHVWMKRALEKDALFIISPDLDIPSLIEKENYPMIWIDFLFAGNVNPTIGMQTREVKRSLWVQYVHDRIQAKLKFFNQKFGETNEKGNNTQAP